MSKKIKQMVMSEIEQQLGETRNMLFVDASRLDANSTNEWRLALSKSDITALTVKNTLARRVLADKGIEGLESAFEGPTTLVWGGEDVVELSKSITKWAKDLEALTVKGAAIEGNVLDEAGVMQLSKSPGRAELLSEIAGLLLAPARQIAGALLGPGGRISGQVQAIAEKEEGSEG
ncbi:MAG: 50S ribosomal protein L10 [Planctomycetes bacterium]|nr:50S ribosomal protein L10 [Planctomycetota bacterium]